MASVREVVSKRGGTTFQVMYRHGKRQSSRTFDNRKSADQFKGLVDTIGPEEALKYLAPAVVAPVGITVDELAEKWLAAIAGDVTPHIHRGYSNDYDNWIHKRLGNREAAKVTEVDVQDWVDWMRVTKSKRTGQRLGPKTIADRHAILHQMFKWGSSKTRGIVPSNPCRETELPKRVKTNVKGLTLVELQELVSVTIRADSDDTHELKRAHNLREVADLAAFIAGTGWRGGESLALPRRAVEEVFDPATGECVGVWVTMGQVRRQSVGIVEDAKSQASLGRRLRVLGPSADNLRRRIVGLAPDDLVFTFVDGRLGRTEVRAWNPNSFRARFKELCKLAGLADRNPTPHWLRHTHVALCHAAGMSLAEIQRRLGHDDIQTTINIYGRMIEEMDDAMAARADALFMKRPAVISGSVVSAIDT